MPESGDDPGSRPARRIPGWALLLAKATVTSAALAWALSRTSLPAMREALGRVSPMAPALVVLVLCANLFVGAFRWREVMRAYGVNPLPRVRFLVHGYLVAGFYNTLVPGNVGGDALRAHAARDAFTHRADSFVAVLIERGLGFAALVLVAGAGSVRSRALPPWAGPALFVTGASLVGVSLALPVVLHRFARWLPGRLRALSSMISTPRGLAPLALATAWSVVSQLFVFLGSHILIHDLDPRVRVLDSLAVIPFATLSAYVPISIAGLGLREAAFVILLGRIGVSPESATAASLAFMAALLVVSALGGVVHALRPLALPAEQGVTRDAVR